MTPKLSIFTLIGNIGNTPNYWQYAFEEALRCYGELADEVIVVWGGDGELKQTHPEIKVINKPWPYDFHWSEIAKHFNAGYAACTGDWVLKMDIDYFIHENDFDTLREYLKLASKQNFPALSFPKFTVMNKEQGYEKVEVPFCINKKMMGDQVAFGKATDEDHNAWGYPIMKRGFDETTGLPTGPLLQQCRRTGIKLWNYDNSFRDKKITGEHFLRFSKARKAAGFNQEWGATEEEALYRFSVQMMSRLWKMNNSYVPLMDNSHPKWIKDRVKNLTPEQFMFNNWNNFQGIL